MNKFVIICLTIFSSIFLFGCSLRVESESDSETEPDPKAIDFQSLTTSQVNRVYIVSYMNKRRDLVKLAELTYDDIDALVELLNQIELNGEASDRFTDVTGMYWHMYRIELDNGQEFDFAADNHFYVIDLKGFDADAETGSAILRQYGAWSEEYFPEDYLEN
ncbi:MAG: hypothetical protein LUG83_04225 [Lachnospiraceae bacterium]|nr:hypothetical protein [Lachnospiraceae bacterium]